MSLMKRKRYTEEQIIAVVKQHEAGRMVCQKMSGFHRSARDCNAGVNDRKTLIFISCGQSTDEERSIGDKIEALIRDKTTFDGYFAKNQSTLESLTAAGVLTALDHAVGFVGVMHYRGAIQTQEGGKQRASIWIEQEIAMAAYMRQVLKRNIFVLLYAQPGIALEGVRQILQLNPIPFDASRSLLADLEERLRHWTATPHLAAKITIDINYTRMPPTPGVPIGELHNYQFDVWATNTGEDEWRTYRVEVEFPYQYLSDGVVFAAEDKNRRTGTHRFFRHTESAWPGQVIYPGDRKLLLSLPYVMSTQLHMNNPAQSWRQQIVRVSVFANGQYESVAMPFSELISFKLLASSSDRLRAIRTALLSGFCRTPTKSAQPRDG